MQCISLRGDCSRQSKQQYDERSRSFQCHLVKSNKTKCFCAKFVFKKTASKSIGFSIGIWTLNKHIHMRGKTFRGCYWYFLKSPSPPLDGKIFCIATHFYKWSTTTFDIRLERLAFSQLGVMKTNPTMTWHITRTTTTHICVCFSSEHV